jgi:hypothetical protein
MNYMFVMAGLAPAIHVCLFAKQNVGARHKAEQDVERMRAEL